MIDIKRIIDEELINVFFQAILSPNEATSINVESFIRGVDPNTGLMVPPGYLFEIASQQKLEHQLDLVCLKKTFEKFSTFHAKNSHAMLYLNINPSFFLDAISEKHLLNLATSYNISTRNVVIDISNLFITDNDYVNQSYQDLITELRKQGFYISIDDIGRNYFNLDRILFFNPDVIKINHQMFNRLSNNTYKRLLFNQVIALAHHMGILVISTGVESQEDVYDSLEAGAQLIQGFFVSEPLDCSYDDIVHVVEDFDRNFIYQHIDKKYENAKRDAINNVLGFINVLRDEMKESSLDNIDALAKNFLNKYPFIESGYLIDPKGVQTTPSYINKHNFNQRNKELFGLFSEGTYHGQAETYQTLQHPLLTDWVTKPHRSKLSNRIILTASFQLKADFYDDYIVVMNIDYLDFELYAGSHPLPIKF